MGDRRRLQLHPEQLRATGWLKLVGGVIVQHKLPSCGDRTLGFFVVSNKMAHAVVGAWVVGDAADFRPHSPVRLVLKAKPNSIMVRTLKPPLAIGVDPPFGPIPLYE